MIGVVLVFLAGICICLYIRKQTEPVIQEALLCLEQLFAIYTSSLGLLLSCNASVYVPFHPQKYYKALQKAYIQQEDVTSNEAKDIQTVITVYAEAYAKYALALKKVERLFTGPIVERVFIFCYLPELCRLDAIKYLRSTAVFI